MECELCGSRNATRKTKIDNAILTTCDECTTFGQEMPKVELTSSKKFVPKLELEGGIVANFHHLISSARSKRGMTQEELAKKLNEKYSIVKRIEEGWEPPMATIKKFEKFFGIKLTEVTKEENVSRKVEKANLTIGDVAEVN
jgi:putative transcription factor